MTELIGSKDVMTTSDSYVLSYSGKKLLEVLINPEHYGKSVTEKCLITNICRDTYYRLMADDEFVTILNTTSVDLIKSHVSEILASTLKYALKDPKCHSDRKMLLQIGGLVDKEFDSNNIIVIKMD